MSYVPDEHINGFILAISEIQPTKSVKVTVIQSK